MEELFSPSEVDYETALSMARDIAEGALWSGDVCAFLGALPAERPGDLPRQAVLRGDLYEGSAGIARFLGLAARLSNDPTLRRTALGAVRHALAHTEGWSLHSGRLGAGLVALEVAAELDEPDLVTPAVQTIEAASEAALAEAAKAPADLLAGVAGVVHGLVEALPYDLDGGWLARSFDLGRALLAGAQATPTGLCWLVAPDRAECLCGLGHGASGAALALSRLSSLAPQEPGWARAASAARGFERGWFSPEHASWADLRSESITGGAPAYPHFWCHGSVGIGQERVLAVAAGVADPLCRADAAAALAGAVAEAERILVLPAGPGGSDRINASVCHGIGGIVDLLAEAWRLERDPEALPLMRRLTSFIRNDAGRERRWRTGIPGGGMATPGLMLGSAGIGWTHLRAWNPDAVSSAWTPRIAPAIGGQSLHTDLNRSTSHSGGGSPLPALRVVEPVDDCY